MIRPGNWEVGWCNIGAAPRRRGLAESQGGQFVGVHDGFHLHRILRAPTREGSQLLIGFLGGANAEKVNLMALAAKRIMVSGLRPRTNTEKAVLAMALTEHVWPILSAGRCWPILDRIFPLSAAADAHRRMESGAHIGKIVLRVTD